ncbi:MAG: PD-(D/E)XK nuclease family transposase [Lachnospiraceae bacterium]|nr:PD-(D/E)XK nuclease family transposase [Lachnospiraceae bacterium]
MKQNKLNHLGQSIASSDNKAEYDDAVKELLADKQLLAWILKWTTEEFVSMEIDDIIPCIENPMISNIPVYPGLTNEAIEGMRNESKVVGEGYVTYDVRFNVMIPGDGDKKAIRMIVDVEAQKNPYPGYDLISRGVFYGGRMLSDQMGRNLDGKDYDKLEKVYSIWIVFNCPAKNANTTTTYKLKQEMTHGKAELNHRYDLMTIVEVRLPGFENQAGSHNKPTRFHEMLYDVFVRREDPEQKMKRLEEKYNLRTKDLERSVKDMCNLSDYVEERGIQQGMEQLNGLYSWLINQNRMDDVKTATTDPAYQKQLFAEMEAAMNS